MNKIITAHFTVNGVPSLGLVPSIDIFELDGTNPSLNTQVVSSDALVEVGIGFYRYDFTTFNPTSNYVFVIDGGAGIVGPDRYKFGGNESYVEDIAPAVWDQTLVNHTISGSTGMALNQLQADVASLMISEVALASLLNTLLKYERNRTKIDIPSAQMIIYDDDGVTPLTTFDLRDFNGMPNIQEVCERIPTI